MSSTRKEITDFQIEAAVTAYRAVLSENRGELGSAVIQRLLVEPAFSAEQLRMLRKRIEEIERLIVCRVSVHANRTPAEMLKATDRPLLSVEEALRNMPGGESGDRDIFFFSLDYEASDDELDREYALRILTPADPYALAELNAVRYGFSDEYPNITHWRDGKGNCCYLAFRKLLTGRYAYVGRHTPPWNKCWYHAGIRSRSLKA